MSRAMRQANLVVPEQFVVEEVAIPEPGKAEVRIAVISCAICGSDIHAFHGEHPFMPAPLVMGHEFSGVVDALGPGVTGLEVGARAIVEPGLVCGECEQCLGGRYNICENLKVIGCQSAGAFADYITVPARNVLPLPATMSFEQGAMVEPLAVAVHALRRADLSRAKRVLVVGAGPIGLLTAWTAVAWGIPEVIVTDVVDYRLTIARELGATYAVNVKESSPTKFFSERYGKPNAVDVVMECVGSEATLAQAIDSVKKGGQIVIVGVPSRDPRIRLSWVQDRELEIIGTLMYMRGDFEEAIRLISSGQVRPERLISTRYPLNRIAEAMDDLLANRDSTIKTLITIRG